MSRSHEAIAVQSNSAEDLRTRPASRARDLTLIGCALLVVWAEVINHLRAEWTVNPQYEYGWLVPLLVLYLFWLRWRDRPAIQSPTYRAAALAIAGIALLLLLPARIVSIANPDWRLLSWSLAFAGVVVSLCAFYLAGGKSWLSHFAFASAFLLVATPWPVQFEQSIVQSLMRADTAIVVKLLNVIGTAAIQRGNVIELPTGLVGIADACTGIRSLQSTLMIALFLGEFYRLSLSRRLTILVAAALLAFLFNVARTFLLCLVASRKGLDAMHGWHDSAGVTILVVCVVALWFLASGLKTKGRTFAIKPTVAVWPQTAFLRAFAIAVIAWIASIEIAAATWYRSHGSNELASNSWSVLWPEREANFTEVTIPTEAREMLSYDDGGGGSWKGKDSHHWLMYYFHWLPGKTAARFVKFHRPDICLPASGMVMLHDSGINQQTVNGISLPIRAYRFEKDGTPIDVFYCYTDARATSDETMSTAEDWTVRGRLRSALSGERERGAQMLELVAFGYSTADEAALAAVKELQGIVRPH